MDVSDKTDLTSSHLSELRTEKCLFDDQEIELPEVLLEDGLVFSEVISKETWNTCLTEEDCSKLLKFLPQFPENDAAEKQTTLEMLFAGKNFKFGNPLKQFHKKLKDGRYLPDIARYVSLCQKAKQQEYQFQQEMYYENLLCEILLNRQRILEELYRNPPEETVKFDHVYWSHDPSKQKDQNLNHRVNQKCHQLIREVNQECGQAETSSDEEEDSFASSVVFSSASARNQQLQQQQHKQTTKGPAIIPSSPDFSRSSVVETFAPRSTLQSPVTPNMGSPVFKRWQQSGKHPLTDVTGEDYQEMMRKHKRRKMEYPDHPELDTTGITLDDIIARTQISKKIKATPTLNCKKKLKKSDAANKKFSLKSNDVDLTPASIGFGNTILKQAMMSPDLDFVSSVDRQDAGDMLPSIKIKKESSDEEIDVQALSSLRQNFGRYANFFSLLKELICEDPEEKIVTSKLEEKVREWQESESVVKLSPWFKEQPNWVDLVSSALKFLSGDILGLSLDNFIPLLDYKERAQQWRWIGQGRDGDDELSNLYAHWAEHRDTEQFDSGSDRMAPVPPPRMWTDYVVRPSTEEERVQFQAQERERFNNPHRAYTYRVHSYESVVGPVKGVYAKESAIIKAREHALLVKDRPSYVTILTLVHDGAARLPNGEGTRNDICELLKDSQFLAPGVTESQINTVVSGALDRLHYEKDPCVKYDGTRKLWIYRHRNRTEEEFEKIHQAQAAAAKAKKMALPKKSKVVKSSNSKKAKEPTGNAAQRLLETLMAQASALESSSSAPMVLPHTPVTYSPSSLSTPTSLTSISSLSSDVTTAFLSSPGGLVSLGGQKGLALSMGNITVSPLPATMKPLMGDTDVLVSTPTKTTNVDVRLHPVTPISKPFTISLVQQQQQLQQQKSVTMTTLPSSIQHHLLPGSKSVPFSLIQSQLSASAKPASVATATPSPSSLPSAALSSTDIVWPQSKAAILLSSPMASSDGSKAKVVSLQHLSKSVHLPSSVASHLQQQQLKAQQQQQQSGSLVGSPASISVLQASSRLPNTSPAARPLVTGIVQHAQQQQQRLSSVNLPVSGKSGAGFQSGGKSLYATPSTFVEVKDGLTATVTASNKILSSPVGPSSAASTPTTMMKAEATVAVTTPSSSILTQQLAAQILKPIGGKPVFISGKPATILASGKPFSIGGKQMLISRGSAGQVVETVVPPTPAASIARTVTSGSNIPSQVAVVSAASTPKSTVSSSLMSQILQSGTLLSQQGLFRGGLVRVSSNGQVIFSGQQPIRGAGAVQNQVRLANPAASQMRLMSIPTGALGQTTRIVVPDQTGIIMAAAQLQPQSSADMSVDKKTTIVTSFANVVGTQMFLQQPSNIAVQQSQQGTRPGTLQSALIAQSAKSEQNIQLIKSLIATQTPASASKQPQQTAAILLANPASHSLSIAVEQGEKSLSGPCNRAKTGPVFARIISPPGNIRLASVPSGPILAPSQLTAMQGLVQVSGNHLSLDASQIQQLVAAQKQRLDAPAEKPDSSSAEADSR